MWRRAARWVGPEGRRIAPTVRAASAIMGTRPKRRTVGLLLQPGRKAKTIGWPCTAKGAFAISPMGMEPAAAILQRLLSVGLFPRAVRFLV
jgi:hypothetical protein